MSTQGRLDFPPDEATELTTLGKRIEILRIQRGISKQRLASRAGTSRQQLWRVMTGKSELTTSLRGRLADALGADATTLGSNETISPTIVAPVAIFASTTVSDYLTDTTHVAATLRTIPAGDGGRRLKRALLNAVEDLAVESGRVLPLDYSDIRRRVLAGEL